MARLHLVKMLSATANWLLNHHRIRLAQWTWWACRLVRDWGTRRTAPSPRHLPCLECGHDPCDEGCFR